MLKNHFWHFKFNENKTSEKYDAGKTNKTANHKAYLKEIFQNSEEQNLTGKLENRPGKDNIHIE